jgi:hypothetical protein
VFGCKTRYISCVAIIPNLELTHGQMLQAIAFGREPGAEVRDKARYLRQLGIPRPPGAGPGKGQRVVYGFDDLALVGFGLLALGEGYRPRVLTELMAHGRVELVGYIRAAWTNYTEEFVNGAWTKMRGKSLTTLAEPWYLRLHGRAGKQMAGIELVQGRGDDASSAVVPYEVIPGEAPAKLFEIDYWLPQWVAWACAAPPQPRGRQIVGPPE